MSNLPTNPVTADHLRSLPGSEAPRTYGNFGVSSESLPPAPPAPPAARTPNRSLSSHQAAIEPKSPPPPPPSPNRSDMKEAIAHQRQIVKEQTEGIEKRSGTHVSAEYVDPKTPLGKDKVRLRINFETGTINGKNVLQELAKNPALDGHNLAKGLLHNCLNKNILDNNFSQGGRKEALKEVIQYLFQPKIMQELQGGIP